MSKFVVAQATRESMQDLVVEWSAAMPAAEISTLEVYLASNSEWFLIKEEDSIFGFFSMTPVPFPKAAHYKNTHRFFFRPNGNEAQEIAYEELEQHLRKIVGAIATSLTFMLEHSSKSQDKCCKIYTDAPEHKFWYIKFAEYLKENYPEQFAVKFYGNWVEITQR